MKIDMAARRKERGLTQMELGERVGIAQRTVAAYESGERRPSIDVAQRLAKELDVAWPDFYDENEESESEEKA